MRKAFEIQKVILESFEQAPYFKRSCLSNVTLDNAITAVVGLRGIGKTTWLLKQAMLHGAKERKALYISLDNFYFSEQPLIELADQIYRETDVRLLCLDEIHRYPNWRQELKNITDTYHDFRVLCTGSSSIDLIHGKYDLSRRMTLHHLFGFSFREYLSFYIEKDFPVLTLDEIIKNHVDIAYTLDTPKILKHFHDYLRTGYYPFFKIFHNEWEKFQAVENATQKTIYEDISTLHALKTPTLSVIEKLFKYIVHTSPGEMSANKLASLLEKDFNSISDYLKYLHEAGLIHFLSQKGSGKNHLRNPKKMYPENTNMLFANYVSEISDATTGKVRETFALNQLINAGFSVYHTDIGDFQIKNYLFEIGGNNKTKKQIKGHQNAYILSDGILIGEHNKIPLFLLGFLY